MDKQTVYGRSADEVIRQNEGLVNTVLWRLRAEGRIPPWLPKADMEDLRQYGRLGVYRAFQKFDPGKGVKFATYATWWIKERVLGALKVRSVIPDVEHAADMRVVDPIERMDAWRELKVRGKACAQALRRVRRALSELSERDAVMMRRAYGLGVPRAPSLAEIGRENGITRERVRLIESKFLKTACVAKKELPVLLEARELLISAGFMRRTGGL